MSMKKKKKCYFTEHGIKHVDFRDTHLLRQFIDPHGKILPRRKTGLCARYHRMVSRAIKLSRYMALMPYIRQ